MNWTPSIDVLKSSLGHVMIWVLEGIMGWKKRLKAKWKPKPAPKPVPVPVPTPVPDTTAKRLAELERKVSEIMATVEELKVKVAALEDVCNAAEMAIDRLSEAVEWLRRNQEDLSGLKEVADKLDEMKGELEASIAASGASGGV